MQSARRSLRFSQAQRARVVGFFFVPARFWIVRGLSVVISAQPPWTELYRLFAHATLTLLACVPLVRSLARLFRYSIDAMALPALPPPPAQAIAWLRSSSQGHRPVYQLTRHGKSRAGVREWSSSDFTPASEDPDSEPATAPEWEDVSEPDKAGSAGSDEREGTETRSDGPPAAGGRQQLVLLSEHPALVRVSLSASLSQASLSTHWRLVTDCWSDRVRPASIAGFSLRSGSAKPTGSRSSSSRCVHHPYLGARRRFNEFALLWAAHAARDSGRSPAVVPCRQPRSLCAVATG